MELASCSKYDIWTEKQFMKILSALKNNKARDPHGLLNEMFKPEFIGEDLRQSLFQLLRKVKEELFIPEFMQMADIHTVYKGKGNKMDLQNERGIFIVNIFRSILMKMVYFDEFQEIDSNMSDSNVGGRRKKWIRNHVCTLNGVINEVLRSKNKSIDI